MNQNNGLWFVFLLSTAAIVGYWVIAFFTWRRRSHPVLASLFYYTIFTSVMDVPLKSLYWFHHHPAAVWASFYLYWIYEPVSDLLNLFIGYRLLCHLCDSAIVRRSALWLFNLMAFGATGLLLLFLSSPFGPHLTMKPLGKRLFIAECCLHLVLCVMTLVLCIFRKSLGLWTNKPMRLIALGLGVMASSSLISSALILFVPHISQVASFPLVSSIEIFGALCAVATWCLALLKTHPAEAATPAMRRNLVLSLNSLNTAGDLLLEITRR